jgi:cytochrome c biogenesis factor
LCITAGYGWCLIVSVLAHVWLVQGARGLNNDHLMKPIKIFTLLSLLFTAVGTILGGIWADQSWGRFWGWDPKENGALLIVLWIVWILHGQISGHIKKHFAMAALAALSIIVSIAWFGVNLLNVGLHSYGFISGMAYSLGGFIAFELMLIGVLLYLAKPAKATS